MRPSQMIKKIKKKYDSDLTFALNQGFTAMICPIYEDVEPCFLESEYDAYSIDELLMENDWDEAVLIDLEKDKTLIVKLSEEAA